MMRATRLSACAYARTGNRDGLGGLLLLQKEPCIALCWPPTACAAKLLLKPCWTCTGLTPMLPTLCVKHCELLCSCLLSVEENLQACMACLADQQNAQMLCRAQRKLNSDAASAPQTNLTAR